MKYSSKHISKTSLKQSFLERSTSTMMKAKAKRLSPLSLRLSETERSELETLANGQSLGLYIKKQLFKNSKHIPPIQKPIIHDQKSVARILRALANSDTIKAMSALAAKHNAENLLLSDEAECALRQACSDISSARKSIRRDVLEDEFLVFLRSLKPTQGLLTLVKAMFKDAWEQRQDQANDALAYIKIEKRKIDKKIEILLDRIVERNNDTVVSAYEKHIDKLEREKMILAENLVNNSKPRHTFDEMFELSFRFLSNPCVLWDTGHIALRRLVLKLAFSERITYCRKTGLRTPEISLPFKALGRFQSGESRMVRPRRLELPRVLPHSDLNAARLPVPPRPQKI